MRILHTLESIQDLIHIHILQNNLHTDLHYFVVAVAERMIKNKEYLADHEGFNNEKLTSKL